MAVLNMAEKHYNAVQLAIRGVSRDVQGSDAFRYARNISGGLQEYVEAIAFQHYLESQQLLSYEAASARINNMTAEQDQYQLGIEDYVLGILDATGEMMRFAITTMALRGQLTGTKSGPQSIREDKDDTQRPKSNIQVERNVLDDLRNLYQHLESLDCGADGHFRKDVQSKLAVTQASVDKVEKALYGLVVRGSERPKGWMPDLQEGIKDTRPEIDGR